MADKAFDSKRPEPFSVSEIRTFVFRYYIKYNELTKYKEVLAWEQFMIKTVEDTKSMVIIYYLV